jgi:hypothetical protein
VRFYVGITDRDWFDYLSRIHDLNEVNFWQPSGSLLWAWLLVASTVFWSDMQDVTGKMNLGRAGAYNESEGNRGFIIWAGT